MPTTTTTTTTTTEAMIAAALGNIASNPDSASDNLRFVVAASNDALLAEVARLRAALADAEFLMRKAAAFPADIHQMRGSLCRSAAKARTLLPAE